ncbi:MAG: hypothetical protein ABSG25_09685 [Bryobacteraceae bacterium]
MNKLETAIELIKVNGYCGVHFECHQCFIGDFRKCGGISEGLNLAIRYLKLHLMSKL